ncbi:lipid A deacylase LpxR family protein [Sphingobacterium sp. SYP-B4668]|uniref:lipid A deacylase LpxR family protein n=1 Tax=Sphingobacterium sp. SYP-B4668 TaxID=2996035 RepID=UPI0022DE1E69|nr:lipid A deacylase LpxR family protein [Sphingobacterium sp. SYP-B4668]
MRLKCGFDLFKADKNPEIIIILSLVCTYIRIFTMYWRRNRVFLKVFLLITICFSMVGASLAQQLNSHFISLQSDNDVYLMTGQDRYYTNGLILTLETPLSQSALKTDLLSLQLGHQLYNGIEVYAGDDVYWDRPSTAYLFLNGRFQRVFSDEWIWAIKTEVGVIGNAAKGKEVQDYVHRVFGMYKVQSWESQLNTSIGVDLEASLAKRIWRSSSNKVELSGGASLRGGMIFSNATAELSLRLGKLSNFHTSHFVGNGSFFDTRSEYYFFYTPSYSSQFYNATLQGGPFAKKKEDRFETMPHIWRHHLGVAYSDSRISIEAGVLFNTKEGKKMYQNHQYGQIKLGLRF